MEYAGTVAFQVGVMFILVLVGFICAKTGMITDTGRKQMSSVVLTVVAPALIFMSYQMEFSGELVQGLIWSFIASAVTYILTIPLAMLFIRKKDNPDVGIERFALIFSNCGFMGIPLISAIFGAEGVLYVTAYVTMFNILTWTMGVMLVKNKSGIKELLKGLRTPTVIAIFLGLICYFTQIKVPALIGRALDYAAAMNTPLPMLVAGATIAKTNVLKAFKKPRVMLMVFYKLLLFPLICAFVLKFLPISEMVYTVVVIATSCPVATTLIMFAIAYDSNDKYSSELFSISTLLSAITIPLVILIISLF